MKNIKSYLAIASFSVGCVISMVCLFLIQPIGEIHTTAISIVSEFLILAGALLGISASFDHKLHKFEADIKQKYNITED